MSRFSSDDSLGAKADSDIANYLLKIGDNEAAREFLDGDIAGQGLFSPIRPWKMTGMMLGYFDAATEGEGAVPIVGVSSIQGDQNLIGKRIKITMDKFFVQSYPGLGTHDILCEFAGKNQVAAEAEELRLALRFKANDNASAARSGTPIFLGVTVGADGISFEGRTVNLASKGDEQLLATFESPAFKNGLTLITTAQPALKPFVGLAGAVVKFLAKQGSNAQIHDFNVGLDFTNGASSARLRFGSYVVVQTDAPNWDWSEFVWDRDALSLKRKTPSNDDLGFNYMVFGVGPFSDA
jgi:hypothetical protein